MAVPQGRIKRFRVIGLQADVLAGHPAHQLPDHRRADALPAVTQHRPDIKQVGVADAVRQQPGHADHPVAVPGDGNMLRSLERGPQRSRGPPVVEVVGRQVRLGPGPVDPVQRFAHAHGHPRIMSRSAAHATTAAAGCRPGTSQHRHRRARRGQDGGTSLLLPGVKASTMYPAPTYES